jgi:hypothetical protein
MLYILSGSLKQDSLRPYKDWLEQNIEDIRGEWPKGWELRGIYFTVFGLGGARTEVHWKIENYASLDVSAADENPRRLELMADWFDFLDHTTIEGKVLKSALSEGISIRAR